VVLVEHAELKAGPNFNSAFSDVLRDLGVLCVNQLCPKSLLRSDSSLLCELSVSLWPLR
jgi:hypothetical protein